MTPVLATLSADGHEVYLVVANGSWTRTVPCHVILERFHADRGSGIAITSDGLDGRPVLASKQEAVAEFPVNTPGNEANCIVPPHAIVFVTLADSP
jgi:hypothetical protein